MAGDVGNEESHGEDEVVAAPVGAARDEGRVLNGHASAGRSKVDELFARIKAGREPAEGEAGVDVPAAGAVAVVEEAGPPETPLAAPAPPEAAEPGPEGEAETEPSDEPAGVPAAPAPQAAAPPKAERPATTAAAQPTTDADLLRRRDDVLDGIERTLSRKLKRVLADEQNEVLALLRQAMPAVLDDLVPERAEHVGRYAAAALSQLDEAGGHGAAAMGGDTAVESCEAMSIELGEALVDPMRERVIRSLEESGGDVDEVTGRLRALYREWKGQHIAVTVRHYAAAAYARGAFEAAPAGTELRWLVDRAGECPDADDNALATNVRKGEPFPTGDRCAPAHPGCRCLVVPVSFPKVSPRGS